jgi:hypothetical protein
MCLIDARDFVIFKSRLTKCQQDNMKLRESKSDGFVIQDISEVRLMMRSRQVCNVISTYSIAAWKWAMS